MPTIERIIEIVLAAGLTFVLGLISKQLEQIKKNRVEHELAYNELMAGFKELKNGMEALSKSVSASEMKTSRYRIIRFDDEEQNGVKHSDDHWDQILEDVDTYSAWCDDPANAWFKNHKGKAAMDRVVEANKNGRSRGNI